MIGILNPAGAAALLAVGVLVALHLFGRRRRAIPVSTLFLWRQIPAQPLHRRRFRPDLLFLAQLAVLLALIGGYLHPYLQTLAPEADRMRLLVVLDASASMQAREPGGTRFELARRRARALVGQLLGGDEVMVVVAADRVHVALRWSADHARAEGRLEELEPLDTPTDLAPAVALALGEQHARPETAVVVLTDLPRDAAGVPPDALAAVDWVQIGATDDNVAVAALVVDTPPFQSVREATATVVIRNYGHVARRVTLATTVDDVPWTRRELTVPPRGSEHVLLTEPPAAGALVVTIDAGDALALDDRAVGWIDAGPSLDVAVVTDADAFGATLATVAAALPGARVERVTPARWDAGDAAAARAVVFDGVDAARPRAVPALYVAPPSASTTCPSERAVEDAAVVDWDGDHPALGALRGLEGIVVPRAAVLVPRAGDARLVLAATARGAFPFLIAGERDGRRVACLAARPGPSTDDVPLLLLVLSTLHWLEGGDAHGALAVQTGVPVSLPAGTATDEHDPGLRVAGDPAIVVAERIGFQRLGERVVAANLFDDRESDIGRSGAREWAPSMRVESRRPGAPAAREFGRALYAAGVLLLAAEWMLWRRRSAP
ncbi:MAG TPA: VWA domain-containing protein [Candidatus Binatia bacterium]|nr:VWA domain-containing protein [Candidatus Binatia bacterium]